MMEATYWGQRRCMAMVVVALVDGVRWQVLLCGEREKKERVKSKGKKGEKPLSYPILTQLFPVNKSYTDEYNMTSQQIIS